MVIFVAKIESSLGDALFISEIDFNKFKPSSKWIDTTHFHVDNEIHIIFSGEALLEIDGEDVRIGAGDICLLAPRSSHYPQSSSDTLQKTNFSFSIAQSLSHGKSEKSFSEYAYYGNVFKSIKEYLIIRDDELLTIVKKLLEKEYTTENEHIFRALLSVFFITLATRVKEHVFSEKADALRGITESESSFRQRKKVEEFFQKRYKSSA